MDLQNVNVRAQALHACINGIKDVFPAQPLPIDHVSVIARGLRDRARDVALVDTEVAFREDDNLGARDVVLFEGFPDDSLGDAMGVDIGLVHDLSASNLHES